MEIVITEHKHCDLVKIIGRIDSYSAPQIEEALNALLIDGHHNIVVDMEDVDFLSSSGILAFVNSKKHLLKLERGEIVFANVSDYIFSGFELAGFNTLFEFYDDVTFAVGRF